MRKAFVVLGASATMLLAATFTPAQALPMGTAGIGPAIDAINTVDKAACWRWGWHGWGWYPCWGPGFGYGWGPRWGWGWGWHRWHHWHRW